MYGMVNYKDIIFGVVAYFYARCKNWFYMHEGIRKSITHTLQMVYHLIAINSILTKRAHTTILHWHSDHTMKSVSRFLLPITPVTLSVQLQKWRKTAPWNVSRTPVQHGTVTWHFTDRGNIYFLDWHFSTLPILNKWNLQSFPPGNCIRIVLSQACMAYTTTFY